MAKSNITLYVDTEQSCRLKDAGWNLSRLFKSTMDLIDSGEYNDVSLLMKVKYFDDEIVILEADIVELQGALYGKMERIKRLKEDKEALLQDWEITKRSVRTTRLTKELNRVIIHNQYDLETVSNSAAEILSGIHEVNPEFKLDRHIIRLKALMES